MSSGFYGLLELVGAWLSKPFVQPDIAACITLTDARLTAITMADSPLTDTSLTDAPLTSVTITDARC